MSYHFCLDWWDVPKLFRGEYLPGGQTDGSLKTKRHRPTRKSFSHPYWKCLRSPKVDLNEINGNSDLCVVVHLEFFVALWKIRKLFWLSSQIPKCRIHDVTFPRDMGT